MYRRYHYPDYLDYDYWPYYYHRRYRWYDRCYDDDWCYRRRYHRYYYPRWY